MIMGWDAKSSAGRLKAPHEQGRSAACSLHLTRQDSKKAPAGINWTGSDGATSSQVRCNFDLQERGKRNQFSEFRGVFNFFALRCCNGLNWHISRRLASVDLAGSFSHWATYNSTVHACGVGVPRGESTWKPCERAAGKGMMLPSTWVPQIKRTELSPAPNSSRASIPARITSGWLESPR